MVYQDINGKRDISGDMMEIDLSPYDVIIAQLSRSHRQGGQNVHNVIEYWLEVVHENYT